MQWKEHGDSTLQPWELKPHFVQTLLPAPKGQFWGKIQADWRGNTAAAWAPDKVAAVWRASVAVGNERCAVMDRMDQTIREPKVGKDLQELMVQPSPYHQHYLLNHVPKEMRGWERQSQLIRG